MASCPRLNIKDSGCAVLELTPPHQLNARGVVFYLRNELLRVKWDGLMVEGGGAVIDEAAEWFTTFDAEFAVVGR